MDTYVSGFFNILQGALKPELVEELMTKIDQEVPNLASLKETEFESD